MTTVLVDGVVMDQVSALDRGVCYGDGLFETLRVIDGVAPLWPGHMRRLKAGCARLRLPAPNIDVLWREVAEVCQDRDTALVRIILTRGVAERGYALPARTKPTRIVAAFALPDMTQESCIKGVRLRWCDTRLAIQPALAGIKHLNRLEQVLARAEWDDEEIFDGLMRDSHGHVIAATSANIFCVCEGRLVTSSLEGCGVAGVARAAILEQFEDAKIVELTTDQVMQASEVFLCNSVRGILPVRQIDTTYFSPGSITRELQNFWAARGWMARARVGESI